MTRTTRETIAYLMIVGFCILMLVWAIPTYTPAYPGYGASPSLVANVAVGVMLFMAILSLVRLLLVQLGKRASPSDEAEFRDETDLVGFTQVGRVNLLHLVIFMVPCFLFVFATEYVAYPIAAFVFLMVMQFAMGNRNWIQMIAIAAIMDALLYVVMRYGFGVPVPGPQLF